MKKKYFFIIITTAILAACSTTENKPKFDYQSANKNIRSLEIPPDLRDPRQGDLYGLPNGVIADPNALQDKVQQNRGVLIPVKNAHIERSGSQRWLVIQDKQASEIWPLLRAFWQENGFTIHSEEPNVGIMETDWAENRAKLPHQGVRKLFDKIGLGSIYTTSERDKFNIRLERNKEKGVDIFFSHKGLEEVYDSKDQDRTVWQPRANDPNLEAAFLARFMQYVGIDEQIIKQQISEQTNQQQGTEFAQLENNTVFVTGNPERNVKRIASALDRIGLTVQQFVHERGIFIVQPAPIESDAVRADKKISFFDKLFGKKTEKEKPKERPNMLVALEATPNGQRIHLLNQDGQPYQNKDLKHLLEKLYLELR